MNKITSFYLLLLIFCLLQTCRTEPKVVDTKIGFQENAEVSIRLMREPSGLSPILTNTSARQIFRLMHQTLVELDPKTLELVPVVAKKRPEVELITEGTDQGGKIYTFEIKDEAAWDDGKAITAHDVLFSAKITYHPGVKTRYGQVVDLIKDIQLDEANPKKLKMMTGECHILNEETIGTMFLYPEHLFDPNNTLREVSLQDLRDEEQLKKIEANQEQMMVATKFTAPEAGRTPGKMLGTGPYKLKEWITGQKIVLEKKKNWWGDKDFEVNPQEIIFEIIPDHVTAMTKLNNGELDICGDLPFELFNDQKSKPNLKDASYDMSAIYYFTLNTENEFLKDKKVRQALAHATNIPEIIENVTYGYAQALSGPFPPGANYYDENLTIRKYDLQKASALLAEAGWTDSDDDGIKDKVIGGKKTDLSLDFYVSTTSKNMKPIADLFLNTTKKAGIKINIVLKDPKLLRKEHLITGNYDISGTGTVASAGLFDPKYRWHSESIPPEGGNYPRFANERADALIEAIRSECDDEATRNKMYKEFHQIIYDEQPVIFLYLPKALMLTNNKVENLVTSSQRPGYFPEYINKKK